MGLEQPEQDGEEAADEDRVDYEAYRGGKLS
jgi:hypothetical protein